MSHQVSPAQSCCRCTKKVGGYSRVHTPRPMWVTGKWDTALIQGPMRVGGQPINRLALAALTSSRDPEDHCRSALRHSICNRTSLRTLRHQTRRDVGASLRRPNHCRSQVALISPKMVASRHRRNLPHSISQGSIAAGVTTGGRGPLVPPSSHCFCVITFRSPRQRDFPAGRTILFPPDCIMDSPDLCKTGFAPCTNIASPADAV